MQEDTKNQIKLKLLLVYKIMANFKQIIQNTWCFSLFQYYFFRFTVECILFIYVVVSSRFWIFIVALLLFGYTLYIQDNKQQQIPER